MLLQLLNYYTATSVATVTTATKLMTLMLYTYNLTHQMFKSKLTRVKIFVEKNKEEILVTFETTHKKRCFLGSLTSPSYSSIREISIWYFIVSRVKVAWLQYIEINSLYNTNNCLCKYHLSLLRTGCHAVVWDGTVIGKISTVSHESYSETLSSVIYGIWRITKAPMSVN